MVIVNRPGYVLLLGDDSVSLFDYFGVEELHGLEKSVALKYNDTEDDAYIAGMSNYHPYDKSLSKSPKPYVFINKKRLKNDYRDVTLLMHELTHQGILQHNYDMELEELFISWAENEVNYIMKYNLLYK